MPETRDILLVADDFAISAGVTDGISTLAAAGRISATSAIVTLDRWSTDAPRLADLRPDIAIGLHVNLTLGAPLGDMPKLAPQGILPPLPHLINRALTGRIDADEVAREITRQLVRYEQMTGHAPDLIDGHQHVHALPGVRHALVTALTRHFAGRRMKPLIRIPRPRLQGAATATGTGAKALLLAALSVGFEKAVRDADFPANTTFAGVTRFADTDDDVRHDLAAAAKVEGGLHLVMCHPGVPSAELAERDPITTRRAVELALLAQDNVLTPRLIHPRRGKMSTTIDWRQYAGLAR